MQFQVPQFIEVEDKIFGPLTAKQFVYLAGGIGFFVAMWLILPFFLAVLIGAPVAMFGAALAFYKINERPFISVLEAAFLYFTKKKLYIWDKKKVGPQSVDDMLLTTSDTAEDPTKYVPAATGSKIKDLAWSLDIHESLYSDKNQQK